LLIISHSECRSLGLLNKHFVVLLKFHMFSTESNCTVMNNVSMVRLVAIDVLMIFVAECNTCIVNLALVILTLCLGSDVVSHRMVWLGSLHFIHSKRSSALCIG